MLDRHGGHFQEIFWMFDEVGAKKKVMSVVGTYLKPEMHTIYRQLSNIRDFEQIVVAERIQNEEIFPISNLVKLEKTSSMRSSYSGNPFASLSSYMKEKIRRKIRRKIKQRVERERGFYLMGKRVGIDMLRLGCMRRIYVESAYYSDYDLIDAAKKNKPDLIHVYFGHKAVGYLSQLSEIGLPWIVSFHGFDIAKNMECVHYRSLFYKMCDSATLIFARSESLLRQLASMGCSKEKLRLNRTVIPMHEFPFIKRIAPADGDWVIVQACRLIPKKGLASAIAAIDIVRRAFPKVTFLIYGEGPLERGLKLLVKELSLDCVLFMGRVDMQDLINVYKQAHIFLHPSEMVANGDQEGVPNAILEAMATGMPYISTYHGGIPEVLADGKGGYLVPEKSPEKLALALNKLMSNPAIYQIMSEKAKLVVENQFSLRTERHQLEKIYNEACQVDCV